MNIGKAIKILLVKKGLTQKDLSDKTGLSQTAISLLIKGHTQPRKENLTLIAEALGVKAEFLVLLSVDKDDVPKDRRDLYDELWPQLEAKFLDLFVK